MQITVLTLFPKMIEGFLSESILNRAIKSGVVGVELVDLRNWGIGRWKKVDDTPYGGGAGMVLRPDVVVSAIQELKAQNSKSESRVILLTPQGEKYSQKKAQELVGKIVDDSCGLILICGHYEGFDERIRDYVDEEISIGDYVLTGGELAAAVIIDSVVRLAPGALGKEASHQEDSFSIQNSKIKNQNWLEYPHYTKPEEFKGKRVPKVLLSGHHQKIKEWRFEQSKKRTQEKRPDLLVENE